jgi:hypothetical protein
LGSLVIGLMGTRAHGISWAHGIFWALGLMG